MNLIMRFTATYVIVSCLLLVPVYVYYFVVHCVVHCVHDRLFCVCVYLVMWSLIKYFSIVWQLFCKKVNPQVESHILLISFVALGNSSVPSCCYNSSSPAAFLAVPDGLLC